MPTAARFLPQALLLFKRPSLPSPATLADRQGFQRSSFCRFWSPLPRLLVHASSSSTGTPFDGLEFERKSPKCSSKANPTYETRVEDTVERVLAYDKLHSIKRYHIMGHFCRIITESVMLNVLQEIQPFDVSLIQKDVPASTIDAMKRTISGILGLLPSNQFHVFVEALWEPLLKLLISSTKTGYTLHNAEYRLFLERNLKIHNERSEQEQSDSPDKLIDRFPTKSDFLGRNDAYCNQKGCGGLEELTPEIQEYIRYLQCRLHSAEKELDDIKRSNPGPQMQQCVEEEKSDLLDYLRSLELEKVLELSEPTCPAVDGIIRSVMQGLLVTLFPEMQLKPPLSENRTVGTLHIEKDNCAELVDSTSTQFQPITKVPRDYLACLLFWCMLLGHYIRGLEYRMELIDGETAVQ